jgi:uroporphyrinogen decarboxylase
VRGDPGGWDSGEPDIVPSFCADFGTISTAAMYGGTTDAVRAAARQALRDAGDGGGFILSTGDQCGRDTPEDNLFAMVGTAKTHGVYDWKTGRLKQQ